MRNSSMPPYNLLFCGSISNWYRRPSERTDRVSPDPVSGTAFPLRNMLHAGGFAHAVIDSLTSESTRPVVTCFAVRISATFPSGSGPHKIRCVP